MQNHSRKDLALVQKEDQLCGQESVYIQKLDLLNTSVHLSSFLSDTKQKAEDTRKLTTNLQHHFTKYQSQGTLERVVGDGSGARVRVCVHHKAQRKEAHFLYIPYMKITELLSS